ncbi:benzoate-CoA ligase family protein, partial [Azospirillum sp. TSO22-1]|uniref:benzoate-CoA ligase family protein n=1 Tax=Azospirillum sp. TSO22-1 TaxID=716789 RepID=UPI000D60E24F
MTLTLPTLTVDTAQSPAVLTFGPGFNAAVPFIDRHLAEGRGAKVAIRTTSGREVTYADLAANVNRCGNALRALGLAPGQRLLMVVKDCPEFLFLFWGAIKAGIVPVPLNTLLRTADYRYMIEDSGCAALVWSPEFAAEVLPALQEAKPAPAVALPVEGEGTTIVARMAEASEDLEPVPSAATAPCFWLYSSGSTGRPKGAVHRQRDMVATSQWYGQEVLGVREDDVCFSAAKLFFAYGLGNGNTVPLWAGASVVLLDSKPTPDNTFATIERFKPTIFFGVPTLYAAQLQALETATPDLSSLRVCVSAGEPLPADLFRRWQERTGTLILDGIGSTEALHIFISNRHEDARPGFSGTPVPGYAVRIVDDAGAPVADGGSGRLQVKGWSTAAYYWNNPEKTAATMLGEWLDTGDTYSRDAEGYYQYCGRSDDMLKVGGIWCSPIEIESRLVSHPKVLEVAVIGAPDGAGLVKPEAWVVLRDGVRASEGLADELMQHCKAALAPYKFPRHIHFVQDLPKTATGKIQRFRLRQM